LTGEHDPNSSPAMSQAMADIAPQGRARVLDGQRHMMSLTAPAEVNRSLLEFLDVAVSGSNPVARSNLAPQAGVTVDRPAAGIDERRNSA
jgi:hypothetical protein